MDRRHIAEHVDASAKSLPAQPGMRVGRGLDQDGIHEARFQHLVGIIENLDALEIAGRLFPGRLLGVGYRGDFEAADGAAGADENGASQPISDYSDPNTRHCVFLLFKRDPEAGPGSPLQSSAALRAKSPAPGKTANGTRE